MQFTLRYGERVIGAVEFGPPDERGHRFGTLVPTPEYLEARPAVRRLLDGVRALTGASPEAIRNELLAGHAELRAAGLALSDPAGAPVETSFLAVFDGVPLDVDPQLLLFAPLIYVGATFAGRPADSTAPAI